MKIRIWKKTISITIAVVMALGLLPSLSAGAAQKTADDYKAEIAQYETELADLKGQQDKESEYQATLTKQISTLNEQLSVYQSQVDELSLQVSAKETSIASLNDQVLQLEQDIDQKNAEIDQKEAEKQETIEQLKLRMRQDYMTGQTSTLNLLLSSADFGQFLSSIEYIQRIANHDKNLEAQLLQQISDIEEAKKEVENDVVELTAQKEEMETALAELQTQKDEMVAAQTNLKSTASSIQTKLKESEQQSTKLENAAANAEESLEEAQKAYEDVTAAEIQKAIEAAEAAAAANNNNSSSGSGGSSSNGGSSGSSSSGGGSSNSSGWAWPISTSYKITSGYGPRNYGSGYHYGVDFAAPSGTPIYASMAGTVIVSTYGVSGSGYGGYGNVVVVSHSNGYLTLYAHMSSRAVSVGQTVSQGQTLGYVGTTGDSTGNHLHFEVRNSATAARLNPTNFIGTSP